jgi:type IV secretion system protein VirB1
VSALALAAVLSLASQCQSDVAPITLAAIVEHESARNPFAIHDNVDDASYFPESKDQATKLANGLLAKGHASIDAGLGQINARNFAWLGLTTETVFDPCRNIAAESVVLTAFSGYATGSRTRGISNGYAASIIAISGRLKAVPGLPAIPAAPAPKPRPATPVGARVLHPASARLITFGE